MSAFSFTTGPQTKTFEVALLPETQKEELVRGLLEEFDLPVRRVYVHMGGEKEMIIPCRVLGAQNPHSDQDRNPTGGINLTKLTYHCVGCGTSGGLYWFIAEMRDCSTEQAREWIGSKTGLTDVMPIEKFLALLDGIFAGRQREAATVTKYSPKILDGWAATHPYVTEDCGIPEQNVIDLDIGYDPAYKVRVNEDGNPDGRVVVSERITIPHFWRGDLVGWQSRRIWDDGTSKYVSSPDFPKESTLYNYRPKEHRSAVVVEAMLSVAKHLHHRHMVATFGATVTERQAQLLCGYEELIFFLDNDRAGYDALLGKTDKKGKQSRFGLLDYCSSATMVWVAPNPYVEDPKDMTDDQFSEVLEAKVPYSIWSPPAAEDLIRLKPLPEGA